MINIFSFKKENTPQANLKFARGIASELKVKPWGALLRFNLNVFAFLLLVFFLFPFTTSAATLVKPANNLGLVGYWSFDEGTGTVATDFSGNGNTGTTTNISNPATATSGWSVGKRGNALNFDGSNDYVGIADNPILHSSQGTFAAWVNLTDDNDEELYSIRGSANNMSIEIGINTTNNFANELITLCVGNSGNCGSSYETTNRKELFDGKWHHIVVTMDGAAHIYLDGVSKTITSTATEWTADTANTLVSIGSGRNTNFTNGGIDEVRLYNRAITASEVSALYKTGKVINKVPNNLGLVGYWSFNEGTSTKAIDYSGKGNTGTFQTGDTLYPTWVNGKFGKALNFANAQGFINIPANSTINNLAASTISFWVNISAYPGGGHNNYLWRKHDASTAQGWDLILLGDGRLDTFHTFVSGNLEAASAGLGIAGKGWHHIAVVWDGSVTSVNLKYYLDGVLMSHAGDSDGAGALTNDSTENLWLGGDNGGFLSPDVVMDEMRLYNRALSQDEVTSLYQGSKAIFANMSPVNRITNGLVGYWTFDGMDTDWTKNQTYDRSGNSNTGIMTSMSTSSTPSIGKLGQAFKFNGVNNYVEMGDINALDGLTSVTVSAWVNAINAPAEAHIIDKSTCNANAGDVFELFANNHKADFIVNGTVSSVESGSSLTTIDDGTWHFITGRYDGSRVSIWVDGVQESSAALNGETTVSGSRAFQIGGKCNGTDIFFPGKIDEVRVYNRSLSDPEIKQLYLMGR